MPPERWQQHNITFPDRDTARRAITERLAPALLAAEADGQLSGWWFMNKQPWPLRYVADRPSPTMVALLDELVADGIALSCTLAIYEAETEAFGGANAMTAAHALFHEDSRHLLNYPVCAGHLGRRETAVLLMSSLMRAANLDWFEQGDVWAKVAALRPGTDAPAPERSATLISAMRTLMTTEARSLCREGGPFDGHAEWIAAFERAGTTLAYLAAQGDLTRGLRAVIAHHVIFHANRAGLPSEDQHALSHIAREAVMGSSENTASAPAPGSAADSVSAVKTDTLTSAEADAEQLRNALVDQIKANGHARTPAVEAALRAVPRHLFVPDASLTDAYANAPVNIKYDSEGTSISCASQPGIVALMLDQLDAQPGERILELGAGTGYNAALLGHLVGPTGHVTTIDVDDDLVEGARAHLAAAGVTNVEALTRDGALGHAEGAPYDRIVATVGAHGIPHAWLDQLSPGGRLVTPQRLKGSVSRSIIYEKHDGRWLSLGSEMNTFMPLRRGIADDDRRVVPLSADGTVRLQAPSGQLIDADALAGVLDQPRVEQWTEMTVRAGESPEWMELFVSCAVPSGLVRMLFPQSAKGTVLTEDPYPSATAAVEESTVTYLARRPSEQKTPEGGKLWEFGVIGHGPGSDQLAAKVADAIRTWDREYRGREATFEALPLDGPAVEQRPGTFVLDTPLNRILVAWQ
ncbi:MULTISPECIES: methyltransferase, FxLD system [Streptomycetaceae]|uniref:Protein-L-isoaspartate O-methyltransferase n=1 Tax=Streptantibioticus cattleyicolor (strain ATCC 35852 / DSM 46488 / JCM 4925 / NBRC 14057 / NRRL 8057) TaxID=1003195 RepID=F8K4L6_STREN|nr:MULTISPECIES: methyltransferase, FxLD system [Streptomycetaceae]AEW95176.1 O-methyltransferase [Streptantibioticus cattleyicolor NRRL 8057 = DSM 46488]MYS59760.1 methyltransferase, FxLD system [Streptomyces sp. SID5468]CCB75524.1 putative O-methyltransferase [Streptantibioticus cattleyicolor NRRL 8057 = DSM 46488]